ncbi:uncharacterized protein A1O5_13276 [Cladophialophora psammophila CBS 110553]|uniref:Tetraspanin Tsp3 n=1 Tax=Cladophialophora psammophila CBS 110553 TaxID=1182543 RepID=W9VKF0_9EURO|nr:uncharacterized protein A1O5_13276 [Cladophialophora psammophila CBS 110553]EXJ53500.1 hypothetical protein A1O5_13276 [Cladophialophora psammophila CBS 110553]
MSSRVRHNTMYFKSASMKVMSAGLGLAACGLSLWTYIQVRRFALPVTCMISILNILISSAGLAVMWSPRKVVATTENRRYIDFITSYSHVIILVPFALAVLSPTYGVPSDVRACRTEMQWEHLFQAKNEAAVKSIQKQFRCCGFNSMRDRAWPFPSRHVNADACERNLGFETYCGPFLKEKVLHAAIVSCFASVLNIILLLLITSVISKLPTQGHPSYLEVNVRSRLLQGNNDDVQETFEEDRRRRAERDNM